MATQANTSNAQAARGSNSRMKLDKLGILATIASGPDLSQGYEIWRDDNPEAPVVAIMTNLVTKSKNSKTGEMAQVYIIRQDMSPRLAVQTGADAAVCGDCPMRPIIAREIDGPECYVSKGYYSSSTLERIYESYTKGNYPRITPEQAGDIVQKLGLPIRQGAYGGPDIVPTEVWEALDRGKGTSYTHQWRTADKGLARFAMASVSTITEANEAQAQGWRTYRVDTDEIGPQTGEIWCPEKTNNVQCADCGLCNGNRSGKGTKNIVIPVIESKAARARRLAA